MVWRIQVLWDVKLRHWMSDSQPFTHAFIFKDHAVQEEA